MSIADVPVAQLDRALDSDSKGRTFESCQARQKSPENTAFSGLFFFVLRSTYCSTHIFTFAYSNPKCISICLVSHAIFGVAQHF